MNNVAVKELYKYLTTQDRIGRVKAIDQIIKDMNLDCTPEEVMYVVALPSETEQRRFIQKHRLWCDKCKTDQHIVAEPLCTDQSRKESKLTTKVEYYCSNPNTTSSIFSKCWNHVYSYPNITGESKPNIVCREL